MNGSNVYSRARKKNRAQSLQDLELEKLDIHEGKRVESCTRDHFFLFLENDADAFSVPCSEAFEPPNSKTLQSTRLQNMWELI